MKFYRLYITFSLFYLAYSLMGQHRLAENKIDFSMSSDTLTINSGRIVQQLYWSEKGFRTISLHDPYNHNNGLDLNTQLDFYIQGVTDRALDYQVFKNRTELGTHVIEIVTQYENLKVKRQLRACPGVPAIASDYYVRLNSEKEKVNFQTDHITLSSYQLPGDGHWKFRVVEFFDRTDEINHLVQETDLFGYSISSKVHGNVLIAQNLNNFRRLFIIKEAPTPYAQNNYSGFDFELSKSEIKVGGAGIASTDLNQMEWVKAYSVVTGFGGTSERELLSNMRKYWKCARPYNPNNDEMIMMNTWGDRNRDGRINEEFILSELEKAAELGITHYQIDDGWQQGLSKNSSDTLGNTWNLWKQKDWKPHKNRFPNGLNLVVDKAKEYNIELGLWFHPSNHNGYENWKQDSDILIQLYQKYGIKYFKIDGIKLDSKRAEMNLRKFFSEVVEATNGAVSFNLDATADKRGGYHYLYEYGGNIFLENRYTDWANYYPHWTLRNLWRLSKYVQPEKLQIEFLNPYRNKEKYPEDDYLAPANIPLDYQFAITIPGQPLAWFEASGMTHTGQEILKPTIKEYQKHSQGFHAGIILPIGEEPSGGSWTGFQSMNQDGGYFLVFREYAEIEEVGVNSWLAEGEKINCSILMGYGNDFSTVTGANGKIIFALPSKHSFALYKYMRSAK